MFNIVLQTQNNTCMAAVMAMMVNEDEKYVLDWFEHIDPPFYDEDMMIFLAHHGIFLTCGFNLEEKKLTKEDIFDIDINISFDKRPAFVIVESENFEHIHHAVLWNGKEILDPLYKEPQKFSKYKVVTMYPMTTTKRRYENMMGIK